MKTSLLTFTLIILAFNSFAQSSAPAPTTEEEYNYLTKGYRTQIEQGLDMKKGYSLQDFGETVKYGDYSFIFKILVRDAKNEMAAFLVIAKSEISGNKYYLCIPQNNPELMKKYFESYNTWDSSITKAYSRVLSGYLMVTTLSMFEQDKK